MLISNEGHIKLTDFGLSRVTLNREINMIDILTTPSMSKPMQDYSRTPGQVLSLISSFGFYTPVGGKGPVQSPSPVSADMPQLPREFFSPLSISCKDYSMASNKLLRACIDSSAVTPGMPIRSLTPTLLQSRRRYGTSSASSHSRTQLSSMESECCSSPRWEKDIQIHEATDMPLVNNSKDLKQKLLETAISPISSNDSADRICDVKDLVRKCLSEYKEWEEKLCTNNSVQSKEEAKPNCHFSHLGLDNLKKEEKERPMLQKTGIKRCFELVDTSPSQERILVKKNNSEYKRGCKIIEIPEKQSTSLTAEICCLKLEGCMQESCPKENQTKDSNCLEENKGNKSGTPLIAKNLMNELDADYEKDGKLTNFSFVSIDDEKPLASMNIDSDLSLPEISATENHLEKPTFDLNGSIKDVPLEESKSKTMLTLQCCSRRETRDEPMLPVQESKSMDHNQDKSSKYITVVTMGNSTLYPCFLDLQGLFLLAFPGKPD
uniref:Microtubule associated serine/threonine kinase like n=1 Tax=Naja naja TaxID=35670 RepID=A0A8C6YBE2_NAJNA